MQLKLSTPVKWIIAGVLIFLLVTVVFFVITTTTAKPEAMQLFLSEKEKEATMSEFNSISPSKRLTLIIGNNENVYYYSGELNSNNQLAQCKISGLRAVIETFKKKIPEGPVILLKPSPLAQYHTTVSVLDEMQINDIKRYAMLDISDKELQLLESVAAK